MSALWWLMLVSAIASCTASHGISLGRDVPNDAAIHDAGVPAETEAGVPKPGEEEEEEDDD